MAWANKASVAMTGSEVAYTIPADTKAISLLSIGGDTTLAWSSGGATFPLLDEVPFEREDGNLGGRTIYLNGPSTATVYMNYATHYLE